MTWWGAALALVVVFAVMVQAYRVGRENGVNAERLRAQYIFAAARNVAVGGALWIVSERLFGHDRSDAWMQEELRDYLAEKEARRARWER